MRKAGKSLLDEKHEKKSNIYSLQDVVSIIKDPAVDNDIKHSAIALSIAEYTGVIAAIITTVLKLNAPLRLISYAIVLQTPLIFMLCGIIFKEKDSRIARVLSMVAFFLELPFLFYYSGGVTGSGLLWYMFSIMLFALILPAGQSLIFVIIDIISMVSMIIYTNVHGIAVVTISDEALVYNNLACAVLICSSIALIVLVQKYVGKLKTDHISSLNEEIERQMAQQLRFTAMLTHELRNPLNGITGFLQILLMNPHIPEGNKNNIRNSYKLAENMLQTVNDILDFSKIQEGKFEITKTDFNLDEIINSIHAIFDTMAKGKGIELIYDVPDCAYSLHTDGVRLQQVLVNIISNAVKYTESGSVVFSVSVEDDRLTARIKDTGRGMTAEELEYVYEPYKRFDMEKNSKVQGTGLGMCIVKNLVEALEGEISASSEIGVGTEFIVKVPVRINEVGQGIKSGENAADASDISLAGQTVLCVDDDAINLKVLERFIKSQGAEVIMSKSALDAFDILDHVGRRITVIITDNLMPGMTGTEFKRILDEKGIGIPSIILSGAVDEESKKEFSDAGFDAVLEKPVIQSALIESIAKVVTKA